MSTLDTSWVISAGSNGLLAAHNSPPWMALYLAVCKLLDLALALPATTLPQFQMYRWAFVSESNDDNGDKIDEAEDVLVNGGGLTVKDFVPYVVRVARLLLAKMDGEVRPAELKEGQPQLTMTSIKSLDDLGPFFASICENVTRQQTKFKGEKDDKIIDELIERDFVENLPAGDNQIRT